MCWPLWSVHFFRVRVCEFVSSFVKFKTVLAWHLYSMICTICIYIYEELFQNQTPALFHSFLPVFCLRLRLYSIISHSFIQIFKNPCLIFLFYSRNDCALFMLIRFLLFRFAPNFNRLEKVKSKCVWLVLFVFFLFASHLNVPLKIKTHAFIYTHTFTCKHKWKWPKRYAHFNAHTKWGKKAF